MVAAYTVVIVISRMESVAMPRPTVVNAKRQPVPPLSSEELKFWLRINEEHALFIRSGLLNENTPYVNQADTFRQEWAALRARAEKALSEARFAELAADSQAVAEDFYRFIRRILHLTLTCQLAGSTFALFLDHLSRETEYFLQLLTRLSGGMPLYPTAGAREAAFWLRLMGDHAKFIQHRLDPSERTFVQTAADFSREFDQLYLQGQDFVSMLRGEVDEIPSFRRFLQDTRVSAIRLRDFERAAEALIAECRLIGTLPALLADHLRRETDHFLLILAFIEKGPLVPDDIGTDLEIEELAQPFDESVLSSEAEAEEETPLAEEAPTDAEALLPEQPETSAVVGADDEEDDDWRPEAPARVETPSEKKPTKKQEKYSWKGKWPRPLGSLGK